MAVLGYAVLGWTVLGQPDVEVGLGQTGLVSLDEVTAHLNLPAGYDGELQALLDDAIGIIAAETGRQLVVRDITQHDDCPPNRQLVLDALPCPCPTCAPHAAATVILGLTVDGAPVDTVDRRLSGPVLSWAPTVSGSAATWADQGVTVTYRAGYTSTPPWLRLAVLRLVEHLWQKTQQAPHPALGQVGGGYDESQPSPLSYLLPYQVASLIDRHRVLV